MSLIEQPKTLTVVKGWDEHLYEWQKMSAKRLMMALTTNGSAVDTSDVGTGKTFVSLSVCKALRLKPYVICPKAVIPSWRRAADFIGVESIVSNYERVRMGHDFVVKDKKSFKFNFGLEEPVLIFDEAQNCGGFNTQNAKLMMAAKSNMIKAIALSATLADNPTRMRAVGYMLGLFPYEKYFSWAFSRGVRKGLWGGIEFDGKTEHLLRIHREIFPMRGTRIRVSELGDKFPENQVIPEVLDFGNDTKEIDRLWAEMEEELAILKERQSHDKNPDMPMIVQSRARQKIELLKVPIVVDRAISLVEEGKAVAIFCSFNQTVEGLLERISPALSKQGGAAFISGKQKTSEERQAAIDAFQAGKVRVIVCNIMAGGVGINLHDVEGTYPRVSLIFPTFKAEALKQALGRIHRAGAKTKATQYIVYAANTVEEHVCARVEKKLRNMDVLNDGDLCEDFLKLVKKEK